MILATHNTMTYLPPKKKWMKIFKPIYQCQDRSVLQQVNSGVKFFDLRIAFDETGHPEFRHGLVAFEGNVYGILEYLNNFSNINCRIVLERVTEDIDYDLFITFCRRIEHDYSNIVFSCGEDKKTKEVIYDFGNYVPVTEMYGSVRGKGLERIFPKLYAKRHNIELEWEYEKSNYLMLDFV